MGQMRQDNCYIHVSVTAPAHLVIGPEPSLLWFNVTMACRLRVPSVSAPVLLICGHGAATYGQPLGGSVEQWHVGLAVFHVPLWPPGLGFGPDPGGLNGRRGSKS